MARDWTLKRDLIFGLSFLCIFTCTDCFANRFGVADSVKKESEYQVGQDPNRRPEYVAKPPPTRRPGPEGAPGDVDFKPSDPIALANRGRADAIADLDKSIYSASAAREQKARVAETVDRLDKSVFDVNSALSQAQNEGARRRILSQPEREFTCAYFGTCKTMGSLVQIHKPLREQYEDVYKKLEAKEREFLRNAQGDYQTAHALTGHIAQLGQNIKKLDSNLDGSRSGATERSFSTLDQTTRAGGALASLNSPLDPNNPDAASATATNKDGTLKKSEDELPAKMGDNRFAANLGEVKDDKELQKLLGANPLVPESFLKDLEGKLKKISDDKDALAIIQEMGKKAGIDELANLKSLDQLNELEQKAAQVAAGENATPAGGAINNSGASNSYAETAPKDKAEDMTEEDAEFVRAVQGVLASTFGAKDEAAIAGGLDLNPDLGGSGRSVAATALTGDGIGDQTAELFKRARRANHDFYKKHYSKTSKGDKAAKPQA